MGEAGSTSRVFVYCGVGVGKADPSRWGASTKNIYILENFSNPPAHLLSEWNVPFDQGQSLPADLSLYSCLVFPGGSQIQQRNALGDVGMERLQNFIATGKGLLGFCAGAFLGEELVLVKHCANLKRKHPEIRGKLTLRANDGQLLQGCHYHNGPTWALQPSNRTIQVLASIVDTEQTLPKSKMVRRAAIIASGRVILCGPHPEHTPSPEALKLTRKLLALAMGDES